MNNIADYFRPFLNLLFGSGNSLLYLLPPNSVAQYLTEYSSQHSLEYFITSLLGRPSVIFSCFVWGFFAILSFNLLLVFPYKWIRSVIKKCKI